MKRSHLASKQAHQGLLKHIGIILLTLMLLVPALLPVKKANALGPYEALGYIDVTNHSPDGNGNLHNADPTGNQDSTQAFQDSLNEAFTKGLAVFVPSGTYKVSDTLNMKVAASAFNGIDRRAYQIIGSTASGSRPIIKLADGSSGFNDPANPKSVFVAWLCKDTACSGNDANQNFNQRISNLEINLGSGNSGAVGIDMQSAEGSGITNVKVDASGAYAGIKNLPGSGGSIQDLEVDGGQYGVYGAGAQPSPTIAGLTLSGQTVNGIYYNGNSPLTVVGFNITESISPVIGGMVLSGTSQGNQEGSKNLDLIDGTVDVSGGTTNHLVDHGDRNIYIRDVYARNITYADYDTVHSSGDNITNNSGQWTWIQELSRVKNYTAHSVRIADGVNLSNASTILTQLANNPTPPADFVTRHTPTAVLPTFEDAGVINVKSAPYNAAGDGVTDDTAALQAAFSVAGAKVFLPAGTYLIHAPLTLAQDTKVFGVTHYQSVIAPTVSWANCQAGNTGVPCPTTPTAMVTTVDSATSANVFAEISILIPSSGTQIYGLNWRAGRNSTVFYPWVKPQYYNCGTGMTCPSWYSASNQPRQRIIISNNGGGRWFNIWGEISTDTSNPASRFLLTDGTTEPLTFYMLHGQYEHSDANNEFRDSKNITVYGFKSENLNFPTTSILIINNSSNIAVFGHQSNASMNAGLSLIQLTNNSNNILLTNIDRFSNNSGSIVGGTNWNYVSESYGGQTFTMPADIIAAYYKRGTYDILPPSVTITLPSNGASVSGNVTINSSASDDVGVTRVDYFIDGNLIGSASTAPYALSWDSTSAAFGSHTLSAVAYDAAGNSSDPVVSSVNITTSPVPDTTPPSVPTNLSVDPASITTTGLTLSWDASSDNVGVSGYHVYRDGVLVNTGSSTSFSDSGLTPGTNYTYTVDAFDAVGNTSAQSSGLPVSTLTAPDTQPPTTPGTPQATSVTQSSVTLSWTASTDNVGVAGYYIFRDGDSIGLTTDTTFTDDTVAAGTQYSYAIQAYDAANNVSTLSDASLVSTPQPPPPPAGKVGDINNDGVVNIFDLSLLLSNYNTNNASCDLNHDGIVNIFDLSIELSHYGT